MAKLPKFGGFTDVSSLVNKVKSAIDNLAGPGSSDATAEALAKENDPIKSKLLEVELLINQLHDILIIQNKTVSDLAVKYREVKKLAEASLVTTKTASEAAAQKTSDASPESESSQSGDQKSDQSAPSSRSADEPADKT